MKQIKQMIFTQSWEAFVGSPSRGGKYKKLFLISQKLSAVQSMKSAWNDNKWKAKEENEN